MTDHAISDRAYHVQHVVTGRSGLPRDVFVQDWAFLDDTGGDAADPQSVAENAALWLSEFYTTDYAGHSINDYLSQEVVTSVVHVYRLTDPTPRPRYSSSCAVFPNGSYPQQPMQVALRLSLVAERNLPSHRGGPYLGPWGTNAIQNPGEPYVRTELVNTIMAAAEAKLGSFHELTWCLWSRKDNVFRDVTGGWVDNRFDVIRSRGELSGTSRGSFGEYL